MASTFKILEAKKGEYVRFSETKDGRLLRRVAISRLEAGTHLVDIEIPGTELTPTAPSYCTSAEVIGIYSVFEVEVDGVRKAITDVLRENDIFKEEDQIH